MPFIPHTPDDIKAMLAAIGVHEIEQLFDEIPKGLPRATLSRVPDGLSEQAVSRLMMARSPEAKPGSCFMGAGAYEHFIPAAVWEIATRGEFYTAYTPYQAEASQGSLQLIYEYQTMMAELMGMDVSNASLYDGGSALAEAALMAVRIKRSKATRILVPSCVHPFYRKVLHTILGQQGIEIEAVPFALQQGVVSTEQLANINPEGAAALIIPQPNFFGCLEDVDALTDWAHAHDILVIACVNPTAMALLKAPGSWGETGADIACGEGQPLGVPLASGGPYFGFMCCRKEFVRQLPGRIVGRTHDAQGREGFTLTLQAREQHIRRAKATSNICTNQGLVVVAATIYMSLLGAQGLREVALASHHKARQLFQELTAINGVTPVFSRPIFHEFVIQSTTPTEKLLKDLSDLGIQAGFDLHHEYPELKNALLVCVTETKTEEDLQRYRDSLVAVLK
ncbi:aminomethyl-transferring glycine dehydrogenase subunit GcvPA [Candidiatus Paracoxiella cheracis]|uniref:aminomethyl-transferring glycine dehydrogenase subunit GcvPA n=1 Tax=Candidiatus Paracoxiella cheracis TaxID=3405120 RepID=UPI003BF5E222